MVISGVVVDLGLVVVGSGSATRQDPSSLFQLKLPSSSLRHLVLGGPIGSVPSMHVRVQRSMAQLMLPPKTPSSSGQRCHLPSSPTGAGAISSSSSSSMLIVTGSVARVPAVVVVKVVVPSVVVGSALEGAAVHLK